MKTAIISIDGGMNFVELPLEQVDSYKIDPVAYVAAKLGVGKQVYVEYLRIFEDENLTRCDATTKKGKRCLIPINGQDGGPPTLKNYEKVRGGYCKLHGG